jgi:hypothetical protein
MLKMDLEDLRNILACHASGPHFGFAGPLPIPLRRMPYCGFSVAFIFPASQPISSFKNTLEFRDLNYERRSKAEFVFVWNKMFMMRL